MEINPTCNCTHYDVTTALLCREAKWKKADSNYWKVMKDRNVKILFKNCFWTVFCNPLFLILVIHQNKTYWGESANRLFCNSSRAWASHSVTRSVTGNVDCRQKWSRQNQFRWWSKVGLLEWVEDVLLGEPGLPPGPSWQPWGWRPAQQKVLWPQGLVEVGRSGNDCQSSRNHE